MGPHGELPSLRAVLLTRGRLPERERRRLRRRRLAGAVIAGAVVAVPVRADVFKGTHAHSAAAASSAGWTAPAALASCPSVGPASVLFPSDSPYHRTGSGAIVWSASAACPGGAGARVAALGAGEAPAASQAPRSAAGARVAPRGHLLVSAAPFGRIVIAGSRPAAPSRLLAVQGAAAGPFTAEGTVAGALSPATITRAYLGDVALAAPPAPAGGGLQVQIERFFKTSFSAAREAAPGPGSVSSATVALDFRTDALVVWSARGALYARYLPARHPATAVQRLAGVPPGVHVSALLSDDGRAIVAWSQARGAAQSVHLDISRAGVRFGAPTVLERFAAPAGAPAPEASPSLIRLRSESVMIAWSGASEGHWVTRAAPVELTGLGRVGTIAVPERDVLMWSFAPGPYNEAILLWGQPELGPAATSVWAARGFQAPGRRLAFGQAEPLAGPGANSEGTVAIDPSGDRAVAAWRGAGGAVQYSIRDPRPAR